MNPLVASIEGVGFWGDGLPDWQAAQSFVQTGTTQQTPKRPAPMMLAANERRRIPDLVAVALEVASAACQEAARDAATLPAIFTSRTGDQMIIDYLCTTLASDPLALSPTKFHHSVHNVAAGYWTIGNKTHQPATALCAGKASFAQGLLEALAQLAVGADAVLLVSYDGPAVGPLAHVSPSQGLLGAAIVLGRQFVSGQPQCEFRLTEGMAQPGQGPLARLGATNAAAPMLPMFDLLAGVVQCAQIPAGPRQVLQIQVLT